jgi:hypothetical protein
MVYFQYFDFIEVAIFCPQKKFKLEKKHLKQFFLYFLPQCRKKKSSKKQKKTPTETLSTQPLGGLAVDFENFTFQLKFFVSASISINNKPYGKLDFRSH